MSRRCNSSLYLFPWRYFPNTAVKGDDLVRQNCVVTIMAPYDPVSQTTMPQHSPLSQPGATNTFHGAHNHDHNFHSTSLKEQALHLVFVDIPVKFSFLLYRCTIHEQWGMYPINHLLDTVLFLQWEFDLKFSQMTHDQSQPQFTHVQASLYILLL